jgi:exodeoxyribonuclease VII large subunit
LNLLDDDQTPRDGKNILTVRQLNEAISDAMRVAFSSTVWVRGEVQRLPHDAARRTHIYFELHETGQSGAAEYQIPVSLMGWDRSRYGLGKYLDGSDPDFQLANKMEVCLECQVDFYAKFGKLSLKIVGIDKSFALGKLEAQRRATLEYLKAQNLLERNAAIALSEIPLRVGLVTSPDSAAAHDFMTGLEGSPFAFQVTLRGAKMQGQQLQAEVMAALAALQTQAVDVIVITRGGGSRADLSWFDQKDLAVAIATCPVPVITAIGHEIDRSIADQVAHHFCKTPTAAAEFLVERLEIASGRVANAAERLEEMALDLLADARRRLDVDAVLSRAVRTTLLSRTHGFQRLAGRFQTVVSHRLRRHQRLVSGYEAQLVSRVQRRVSLAEKGLQTQALKLNSLTQASLTARSMRLTQAVTRLSREAMRPAELASTRLKNLAFQAKLLDPARLLARGYTLTLDGEGKIISSVDKVAAGDLLRTRFVDGQVISIVQPDGSSGRPPSGKAQARGRKKSKENPGQKTLFR